MSTTATTSGNNNNQTRPHRDQVDLPAKQRDERGERARVGAQDVEVQRDGGLGTGPLDLASGWGDEAVVRGMIVIRACVEESQNSRGQKDANASRAPPHLDGNSAAVGQRGLVDLAK